MPFQSCTLIPLTVLLLSGCYFPSGKYTSTLQPAKTLGAKELETTLIGSTQKNRSHKEDKQWYIGIREAIGISKRFNVRLSMIILHYEDVLKEGEFSFSDDFDAHQNVFFTEAELKWSPATQEFFAFTLPLGGRFEIGNSDYYLSPTLIGSVYPLQALALTASIKLPIQIKSKEFSQALNIGCTYTSDRRPLTITPELGILWSENERITSVSLSLGFIKKSPLQ